MEWCACSECGAAGALQLFQSGGEAPVKKDLEERESNKVRWESVGFQKERLGLGVAGREGACSRVKQLAI